MRQILVSGHIPGPDPRALIFDHPVQRKTGVNRKFQSSRTALRSACLPHNFVLASYIMRHNPLLLLPTLGVCLLASVAPAQKFLPKSIQFQGDPEYSTQELMTAAGLQKGAVLSYSDMNGYTQKLLSTGAFATVGFKFDGQDLIFSLVPSPDLVPIQFQNLPLTPGASLDAKLHERIPLYHGKVPSDGGMAESVRGALVKILAAQGITATIIATTGADLTTGKMNAVVYSITSPAVGVGAVKLDGVSSRWEPMVRNAVDSASKLPFDNQSSSVALRDAIQRFYQDQGYAAVKVQVAPDGTPTSGANGIAVLFAASVAEGRLYKVGQIRLPDCAPLSNDDVQKTLADRPGAPVQGVRVRTVWEMLSRGYKTKGYLDCRVTPHPSFDDVAGVVNYTVDVDRGPVYHLSLVKFDNVSDSLRSLLMHYWQMMPGDPYDENYFPEFFEKAQAQDPVLRRSLAGVKASFNATADPQTHDVNLVIHLSR
jgi:outer membrane protein assembly factor BamA